MGRWSDKRYEQELLMKIRKLYDKIAKDPSLIYLEDRRFTTFIRSLDADDNAAQACFLTLVQNTLHNQESSKHKSDDAESPSRLRTQAVHTRHPAREPHRRPDLRPAVPSLRRVTSRITSRPGPSSEAVPGVVSTISTGQVAPEQGSTGRSPSRFTGGPFSIDSAHPPYRRASIMDLAAFDAPFDSDATLDPFNPMGRTSRQPPHPSILARLATQYANPSAGDDSHGSSQSRSPSPHDPILFSQVQYTHSPEPSATDAPDAPGSPDDHSRAWLTEYTAQQGETGGNAQTRPLHPFAHVSDYILFDSSREAYRERHLPRPAPANESTSTTVSGRRRGRDEFEDDHEAEDERAFRRLLRRRRREREDEQLELQNEEINNSRDTRRDGVVLDLGQNDDLVPALEPPWNAWDDLAL